MQQKIFRALTVLLAVWMWIAAIPITAFSGLVNITTEQMPTDSTVYVLAEDNSKRTAFEKHYYCSDGTFVAVTYPEAVHYQDEQGEWVDVDLRMTNDSAAQAYRSQSGSFKTSFSKPGGRSDASMRSTGDMSAVLPAVSMESGEYALSWTLAGEQPAGAVAGTYAANASGSSSCVLSASEQATAQVMGELKTAAPAMAVQKLPVTDPDAFALPSVANQVIYEDIFGEDQNVSVRYSVSLNKIEEDILITAPTEMTSFSMQIECAGLTPVLNDDNSVDFLDNDGNMVYHISVPYLADAAFAVSYEVGVTLTEQNGTCTVTYTPDAEWMNDPARVYPIMLDPAVTTNEYSYPINDTYVVEGDNNAHYSEQYLYVYQNDGKGRAAILRFSDLPQIDPSMPIISATLRLSTYVGPNGVDLKLESMADGFNFLMDRYSDWQTWNRTEIDRATYSSGTIVFEFDMTCCIADMYSGNIGRDFSVSLYDEDATTYVPTIHSMDTPFGDSYRPCLTITYGYTLPPNLSADDEIMLRNLNSKGYLYPNSGLIGNGNIALHAPATTSSSNYRLITLTEAATGAYKLEYTPSGNHSGSYYSVSKSTKRVVMSNSSASPSDFDQDWLIVPYNRTTFKIVLASDMRYVMTAVGDFVSYISDAATATDGYVNVTQCDDVPTSDQLWYVYLDGERLRNETVSAIVENGAYYLNHDLTGMFLGYSEEEVGMVRGRISALGATVSWQLSLLPDGSYTLQQNVENTTLFLTDEGDHLSMTPVNGIYSDSQKWDISQTTAGYILLNEGTGNFLQLQNEPRTVWDLVKCTEYVELGNNVTFADMTIGIAQTDQADTAVDIPTNTTYASLTKDFVYTSLNPEIATVHAMTGQVTGVSRGVAEIVVIHKVTGMQRTFEVTVEKRAIIIVPGFGGSELFLGASNLYFRKGTPLIDQEMLDIISLLSETTSPEAIALLVGRFILEPVMPTLTATAFANMYYDSLQCNDDGTSKSNIYTKKYYYIHDDNPDDDIIPTELPSNVDSDVYTPHAGMYDIYYDLIYSLHNDPIISMQYSIELFTYDWRLSSLVAAEKLDAFIEEQGYDKVILISHSMGGLVASGYMGLGQEQLDKVLKVCMIASPLEGTPEVIHAWANVNAESLFGISPSFTNGLNNILTFLTLNISPLQKLISNYQSIYELFPTTRYLSASPSHDPYIKYIEVDKTNLVEEIITERYCFDYTSSMQVIPSFLPYFNSTLMDNAEAFHLSCRHNDQHITNEVDCKYYAVTDSPTTVSLDCVRTIKIVEQDFEVIPHESEVGDSLVPFWSATVGRHGSCVQLVTEAGHSSIIGSQKENILEFIKGDTQ